MMKKIGIVILNYLAYEDTMACVDSIWRQNYKDVEIIIVDNASNNGSAVLLTQTYRNCPAVNIIIARENLGYAKGNNLGIKALKAKGIYNVLILNSDVLLTQVDFLEKLSALTSAPEVAMIGPAILTATGRNQNPTKVIHLTAQKIQQSQRYFWRQGLRTLVNRVNFNSNSGSAQDKPDDRSDKSPQLLDSREKMLHGAALFFTEPYLKHQIGFYPETFLYLEEEFLALICRKLGYEQLYLPELSLLHKEDASSKLAEKNPKKAMLRLIRFHLKGLKQMKKALRLSPSQLAEKIHD
jgi:GT2 family glycosyltransferase